MLLGVFNLSLIYCTVLLSYEPYGKVVRVMRDFRQLRLFIRCDDVLLLASKAR